MITAVHSYTNPDRILFTLFIAVVLHLFLLYQVGVGVSINRQVSPTLDITLATHQSQGEPAEADFLAQFNQEGSGTLDEAKQITTEQVSEFDDTQIREVREAQLAKTERSTPEKNVVTTNASSRQSANAKPTQELEAKESVQGDGDKTVPVSEQIASLKAKLDKQRQAYAKRPRVRRLTSVAAKASVDAEYLYHWSQKVEFVGNRNFPKEAMNAGTSGKLRQLAVVDRTGKLVSANILQSSGYRVLDDAAIQIVHLSSPFKPFPEEILETTDRLEIIRTWNFEVSGLSTGR